MAALYDPRRGGAAFEIERLKSGARPFEPPRTNAFSVYWIEEGTGTVRADTGTHRFAGRSLLCFVPYQQLCLEPARPLRGDLLRFHANFLCVETFHAESGCSGALFNDPYGEPSVPLTHPEADEVRELIGRLHREQEERRLGYDEVQLAAMKILLVLATRAKAVVSNGAATNGAEYRHPVLNNLRELIEERFREWHAPADYADQLHMTAKTLGRVVKEHLGRSLTDLIRGRILTHAKWQLLHTLRPVKEIAAEVGFVDELYFSRMFKKAVGLSPRQFREFETEIRGGSNLSMSSSRRSIPGHV
jgi:AraC-like DNA-binding protein